MKKNIAPILHGGGGIGTELKEFDLQRFTTVTNPYTINSLDDDYTITGSTQRPEYRSTYYEYSTRISETESYKNLSFLKSITNWEFDSGIDLKYENTNGIELYFNNDLTYMTSCVTAIYSGVFDTMPQYLDILFTITEINEYLGFTIPYNGGQIYAIYDIAEVNGDLFSFYMYISQNSTTVKIDFTFHD